MEAFAMLYMFANLIAVADEVNTDNKHTHATLFPLSTL